MIILMGVSPARRQVLEQVPHIESTTSQESGDERIGDRPAAADAFVQVYFEQVTEGI